MSIPVSLSLSTYIYWITCLHLSVGAVCVCVCACASVEHIMSSCSAVRNEKAREANLDTSALAECVMYQNNESHLSFYCSPPSRSSPHPRSRFNNAERRLYWPRQSLCSISNQRRRCSAFPDEPPRLHPRSSHRGQRSRALSLQLDPMTLRVFTCSGAHGAGGVTVQAEK